MKSLKRQSTRAVVISNAHSSIFIQYPVTELIVL
jgi:hypothetical protein